MLRTKEGSVQHVSQDQIDKGKRKIWNLAGTGALTRFGGSEKGQARWDLREIHRWVSENPL